MKKATATVLTAFLLAAPAAAWAERNPQDPYEGYNRFMFKVNDTADRYVMTPVARGYRYVTPKPVRTGVGNFFNNLRDVVSFGSNVLRLDAKRASEDLVRVGINTTFGLGGLINIADAGGIPNNKNTLGDTFSSWGWKNSNYFVYPLSGPSTVRDALGNTIVTVYPVDNAIFHTSAGRIGAKATNAVNRREELLDLTDNLDGAVLDRYTATRDLYMQMRARQVGGTLPSSGEDEVDIDDLVAPSSDGGNATDSGDQAVETAGATSETVSPSANDYTRDAAAWVPVTAPASVEAVPSH